MSGRRVVIMGAAGRDFHNFNTLFRGDEGVEVVAFTAAQIPDIEGRRYPPELAGARYPEGIPILAEEALEGLIRERRVDEVWFSYSDVPHEYVMHHASRVTAWGAHFGVCSATRTMLASSRPVISVTAVRTGVGKSQTSRYLSAILKRLGKKAVAVRHPMPYGDLTRQVCQRFAAYEDLDRHETTIEEREEYEPHIDNGFVVYAGIDYEQILRRAEEEAEVILWDGGNNDTSFFAPDLAIVLVDPHRPGDELSYYPGETNLLLADVILVNKVQTAEPENVRRVVANCRAANPRAEILECRSAITLDRPELVRGKRALVVEDGPTLTHGGMSYGAGWFAARDGGAAEIVDPVPYAVGSLVATYESYPNARRILPAMGYGAAQMRDLEATIRAVPADVVVEGTPIDLRRVLDIDKPIANVRYELEELEPGRLEARVRQVLDAG
ncbi:MAG: cyclic 2,3-diphosphoglycerate synthase [Acidobacteriota bacterium]|nr:cyclic 2,3-diphosphoglycerate synthase [Acidobacteriota bacterium]MDH3523197.1 cyclic 2,3-diphosphoglycerate synthase [Acidobacteriota bacterium]